MKINAINSTAYMTKGLSFGHTAVPYPEYDASFKSNTSFGHTAVPYPEYEDAYYYNKKQSQSLSKFIDKISALFTPEVTQKSQEIKSDINKIYESGKNAPDFNGNPKKQLLSVLA